MHATRRAHAARRRRGPQLALGPAALLVRQVAEPLVALELGPLLLELLRAGTRRKGRGMCVMSLILKDIFIFA